MRCKFFLRPLTLFRSIQIGRAAGPTVVRAALVLVCTVYMQPNAVAGRYVGDSECTSCHQTIAHTYRDTAHARTSQLANELCVKGSFVPGKNKLGTSNPLLYFLMESRPDGLVQSAIAGEDAYQREYRSERIDIAIGSGRKGQTYLYWNEENLFQLPVSYWKARNAWINSPGYVDGTANYDRPIRPRCLECHASQFVSRPAPANAYDRHSLALGISCEKCHGPGSEHVSQYRSRESSAPVTATAIVNPARLTRDREMNVCGLCHQGAGEPKSPALSFVPGDDLLKYIAFPIDPPGERIDVHGNQVQLLKSSRCFQKSESLTCSTCHDVHQQQRDVAAFAVKCQSCHAVSDCGEFPKKGHAIAQDCVVCHMPMEGTNLIAPSSGGGRFEHMEVRNHRIGIYSDRR